MMAPAQDRNARGLLETVLSEYMTGVEARGIIHYAFRHCEPESIDPERDGFPPPLIDRLLRGVELFVKDETKKTCCKDRLGGLVGKTDPDASTRAEKNHDPPNGHRAVNGHGAANGHGATPDPSESEAPASAAVKLELIADNDIVVARNQAKDTTAAMGFSKTEQIKIATAVSELARNVIRYATRGELRLEPAPGPATGIQVVCADQGPGIPHLERVLAGAYKSKTGLGLGLLGCKKIMDRFEIHTGPGGTTITAVKYRL